MIFSYNNVCWHVLMNLVRHVQMAQSCWLPNSCSELLRGCPGFVFQTPWMPLIKVAFTKHYEWCITHLIRLENNMAGPSAPYTLLCWYPSSPLQRRAPVVGVPSFQMGATNVMIFSNLHGFCFSVTFYLFFRPSPAAYESRQTTGLIRAATAGLCHSQSNTGSQPHLRPTPQLPVMPDP